MFVFIGTKPQWLEGQILTQFYCGQNCSGFTVTATDCNLADAVLSRSKAKQKYTTVLKALDTLAKF